MIQALIAQHFRDKESKTGQTEQVDIVKGKGIFELCPLDAQLTCTRKGINLTSTWRPRGGEDIDSGSVWTIYVKIDTDIHTEGVAELFRKPLFQITCGKSILLAVKH